MAEKPWEGKSVLIVDDSAAVCADLRRVYEACGMKVVGTAENGVSCLRQMEEKKPDLVSLDIIMPEMDGVECYRLIRDSHPGVKCVFVSWLASEPSVAEAMKDLVPEYLFQSKPVTVDAMTKRLEYVWSPQTVKKDKQSELDLKPADFVSLGLKVS